MKKAILFAGQGSQYTNMGLDFFECEEALKKVKIAEEILGFDVKKILENKENELNNTLYTQPLMALVTIIIYERCLKEGLKVDGFLGFSLGEYVALYAAGIYDFSSIIKIVNNRAILMNDETLKHEGAMAAVLGCPLDVIKEVLEIVKNDYYVDIANYNSKNQIVISGLKQGVLRVIELLKMRGFRKNIMLKVSGAFHSLLMSDAGVKLEKYLNEFKANKNNKDCYMNVTGKKLVFEDLKKNIIDQIQSPVKFYQSIENMIEDGFDEFIEIGPGNVLSTILKKNYPDLKVYNIEKIEDLEKIKGEK